MNLVLFDKYLKKHLKKTDNFSFTPFQIVNFIV